MSRLSSLLRPGDSTFGDSILNRSLREVKFNLIVYETAKAREYCLIFDSWNGISAHVSMIRCHTSPSVIERGGREMMLATRGSCEPTEHMYGYKSQSDHGRIGTCTEQSEWRRSAAEGANYSCTQYLRSRS